MTSNITKALNFSMGANVLTPMKTTTDLETIRKNPAAYTWGQIIDIHSVGSYTITEYLDREPGKTLFGCYVDGKCLGRCAETLEGALIICFAYKKLGDAQATDYMAQAASKLLGVTP